MRRLLCYSSGLGLLVTYLGGAMGFVPPTSKLLPRGKAAVKSKLPLWSTMEGMGGGGGGGGGGDMDSGVNSVQLIGRLGSEPQLKYLESGSCVLSVSLAVRKEMVRNAATAGQMDREEVDWIRIEAWGRTAEFIEQSAQKGSRLLVMGRLITSSWTDKYGQNRSDVKVRVKRAEVLQSRRPETNPELSYNTGWEEGGEMGGMEEEAYGMAQQPRRQAPQQQQQQGGQKRYQAQGAGKARGNMQQQPRGGGRQQPMTYTEEAAPADLGFEIDDYPPF